MAAIKELKATEILDSRGNPTIETTIYLEDGTSEVGACPSGASVGTYEAVELRDNDPKRFHGMGVLKAVDNVNTIIAPKLIGIDAKNQSLIDQTMIELDGTPTKSKLGANALLSVSIAVCKAASKSSTIPLFLYLKQFLKNSNNFLRIPTPLFNILNGGKHAGGNIDFQEFIITPATSKPYQSSLQVGVAVYKSLHDILKQKDLSTLVGDEGGFGPTLSSNLEALSFINQAVEATSYKLGFEVFLGLDIASGSFFTNKKYHLKEKPNDLSSDDMIGYYEELLKKYPLLYLEDPLSEDDFDAWQKLSSKIDNKTIIVGDDLTVTNPHRLQMALDKKAITAIIIKPNQIGTVSEALAVIETARGAGLKIIVSHRSGETNDDFISDFATAVNADYVKFGAIARGERVAKYNRLLHIDNLIRQLEAK